MGNDRLSAGIAKIRLIHGAVNVPAVDIYAGGEVIAKNLAYSSVTGYIPVSGDDNFIQIFRQNTLYPPFMEVNAKIPPHGHFTIVMYEEPGGFSLKSMPDGITPMQNNGYGNMRFANFSKSAESTEFSGKEGEVFAKDLVYSMISPYKQLIPGDFTLQIKDSKGQLILTSPGQSAERGRCKSIYLLGSKNPVIIVANDA